MSIYVSSYSAVIVFMLLTLMSIIDMIKKIYDKIIINNEDITIQRLFKKNQYLKISDIRKAKRKIVDNGKSLMGLFSLDMMKPKTVEYHVDVANFEQYISKFTVKES